MQRPNTTLPQEMDDHRRALQAFKEDLKEAEELGALVIHSKTH